MYSAFQILRAILIGVYAESMLNQMVLFRGFLIVWEKRVLKNKPEQNFQDQDGRGLSPLTIARLKAISRTVNGS